MEICNFLSEFCRKFLQRLLEYCNFVPTHLPTEVSHLAMVMGLGTDDPKDF